MLSDEVKLTTAQRQKWNYFLRNGEPLVEKKPKKNQLPLVTIRPGSSKRRTREDIIKSGAYVREKFKPLVPTMDREKAKKHLQVVLNIIFKSVMCVKAVFNFINNPAFLLLQHPFFWSF